MTSELLEATIEEIALEGIEGITLEALWLRLLHRPASIVVTEEQKNFIWLFLRYHDAVCFHLLPQARPLPLFASGITDENIVDPYPVAILTTEFGSCATFKERVDISAKLRNDEKFIRLETVIEEYGSRLALVASLASRVHYLAGPGVVPDLFMSQVASSLNYAVLERVGRQRQYGILSASVPHSLCNLLKLKPKDMFYILKRLELLGLVTKQSVTLPKFASSGLIGSTSNHIFLKRFQNSTKRKAELQRVIDIVCTLLSRTEDKALCGSHLKRILRRVGCTQPLSRVVAQSNGVIEGDRRTMRREDYFLYLKSMHRLTAQVRHMISMKDGAKGEGEDEDEDELDNLDEDLEDGTDIGGDGCLKDKKESNIFDLIPSMTSSCDQMDADDRYQQILQNDMYTVRFYRLSDRFIGSKTATPAKNDSKNADMAGNEANEEGEEETLEESGSNHFHPFRTQTYQCVDLIRRSGSQGLSCTETCRYFQLGRKQTAKVLSNIAKLYPDQVKVVSESLGKSRINKYLATGEVHDITKALQEFEQKTGKQLDLIANPWLTKRLIKIMILIVQILGDNKIFDFYTNITRVINAMTHTSEKSECDKRTVVKLVGMLCSMGLAKVYPRIVHQCRQEREAHFICDPSVTEDSVEFADAVEQCNLRLSTVANQRPTQLPEMIVVNNTVEDANEGNSSMLDSLSTPDSHQCPLVQSQLASGSLVGSTNEPRSAGKSSGKPNSTSTAKSDLSKSLDRERILPLGAIGAAGTSVESSKACMTFDPSVSTYFGSQPKALRMMILHEFLHYLVRGYKGIGPEFSEKFVRVAKDIKKFYPASAAGTNGIGIDIYESRQRNTSENVASTNEGMESSAGENDLFKLDCAGESYRTGLHSDPDLGGDPDPHVYLDEISWKRFIPPLPIHRGLPKGWLFLRDVALCMPLSLYLMVVTVQYKIFGLEEIMADPIRRHTLVFDLPHPILSALLYRRRHICSLDTLMQLLCAVGLLKPGPQLGISYSKNKEGNFYYLCAKSTLLDTSRSKIGLHFIVEPEDRPFRSYHYTFTDPDVVAFYWQHARAICVSTRLGFRNVVVDESIRDRKRVSHCKTIELLLKDFGVGPVSMKNVPDDGVPPGKRDGAAGFDASLFLHRTAVWMINPSAHCRWFLEALSDRSYEFEQRIVARVDQLSSIFNTYIKPPVDKKVPIMTDRSIEHDTVSDTLNEPPDSKSAMSLPKDIVKTEDKKPSVTAVSDDSDSEMSGMETSSLMMSEAGSRTGGYPPVRKTEPYRRRALFSVEEKEMLLFIKACNFFMVPTLRIWCSASVVRDIMHHFCPSSRNKSVSSLMALAHRQFHRSSVKHNTSVSQRMQHMVEQMKSDLVLAKFRDCNKVYDNTSEMRKNDIFRRIFELSYKRLFRNRFLETLPADIQTFHRLYTLAPVESKQQEKLQLKYNDLRSAVGNYQMNLKLWEPTDGEGVRDAVMHNVLYGFYALDPKEGKAKHLAHLTCRQFSDGCLMRVTTYLRNAGFITNVRSAAVRRASEVNNISANARSANNDFYYKNNYVLSFNYRHQFFHKFHILLSKEVSEFYDNLASAAGGWVDALKEMPGFVPVLGTLAIANRVRFNLHVPESILRNLADPPLSNENEDGNVPSSNPAEEEEFTGFSSDENVSPPRPAKFLTPRVPDSLPLPEDFLEPENSPEKRSEISDDDAKNTASDQSTTKNVTKSTDDTCFRKPLEISSDTENVDQQVEARGSSESELEKFLESNSDINVDDDDDDDDENAVKSKDGGLQLPPPAKRIRFDESTIKSPRSARRKRTSSEEGFDSDSSMVAEGDDDDDRSLGAVVTGARGAGSSFAADDGCSLYSLGTKSQASTRFRMSKLLANCSSSVSQYESNAVGNIKDFCLAPIGVKVAMDPVKQIDFPDFSAIFDKFESGFMVNPREKSMSFDEFLLKLQSDSAKHPSRNWDTINSSLRLIYYCILEAGEVGVNLTEIKKQSSLFTATPGLVQSLIRILVQGRQIQRHGVLEWRYWGVGVPRREWMVQIVNRGDYLVEHSAFDADDNLNVIKESEEAAATKPNIEKINEEITAVPMTDDDFIGTDIYADILDTPKSDGSSPSTITYLTPRPWLKSNGLLNVPMMRWLCEGVFLYVMSLPGLEMSRLADHFNPALSACSLWEIVEFLADIKCLVINYRKMYLHTGSPLFPGRDELHENVFVEPMLDGLLMLSRAFKDIPMPSFVTSSIYSSSATQDGPSASHFFKPGARRKKWMQKK